MSILDRLFKPHVYKAQRQSQAVAAYNAWLESDEAKAKYRGLFIGLEVGDVAHDEVPTQPEARTVHVGQNERRPRVKDRRDAESVRADSWEDASVDIPTPDDAVGRMLEAAVGAVRRDDGTLVHPSVYVDSVFLLAILRIAEAHRTLRAAERARERGRAYFHEGEMTMVQALIRAETARREVTESWQALESLALASEAELAGQESFLASMRHTGR